MSFAIYCGLRSIFQKTGYAALTAPNIRRVGTRCRKPGGWRRTALHFGTINPRLQSPLARDKRDLPLPVKGAILASKPPGIWRMSVREQIAMSRTVMIVACLFFAAGQAAAQGSQATIQQAIQEAGNKWAEAFNKGDAKALAGMYTEDAYVLPPGANLVHGRSAIEAFWRQNMNVSDFKCTTLDVKPLGDKVAREIGTCSWRTKEQPPRVLGNKYAVVWENKGGQWELLQDIWNARPTRDRP